MAVQIPFPNDANFPPEKRRSKIEETIENLFQVLPAASVKQMQERLIERGLGVTESDIRDAIAHLRKHATDFLWTIPHVDTGPSTDEEKYFAILLEKDKSFHTDPAFKANLVAGTANIVTRISTQSKNQSMMLKAAAEATYLSKPLREELREMGDECISMYNKGRRVLRYLKANNG